MGDIVDSAGRKIFYDDERASKANRGQKPPGPGYWIHNGKILLDRDNRPVKPWTDLNRTISSAIADWHLEALRRLYWWATVDEYDIHQKLYQQRP